MANNVNVLPNTTFDNLLLEMIVNENQSNPEINKSIDMTSAYISNNQIDIAISKTAEQNFLNAYKGNFWHNLFWNKITFGIIGFAVISAVIISIVWHKNPQKQLPKQAAIFTSTEKRDHADSIDFVKPIPPVLATAIKTDTLHFHKKRFINHPTQKHQNSQSVVYIPKQNSTTSHWPYDDFDNEIAASLKIGGDDGVKIYPDDYNLVARKYQLISYSKQIPQADEKNMAFLPVYQGKPFRKGFENMVFINITDFEKERKDNPNISRLYIPQGYNYFLDSLSRLDAFFSKKENAKYLQPFYMSKYEVSNTDYKEFLHWVKNYNGYEDLKINEVDSFNEFSTAFMYTFHKKNEEIIKHFGRNSINVYPTKNCWTKDFPYEYNKPMDDHYLTHPAYGNYPVVGVNYWQALAYVDWLTWIWQSRIEAQGIPYEMEYDLPNEYEWQLAQARLMKEAGNANPILSLGSENSICNLSIKNMKDIDYRNSIGINHRIKAYKYFYCAPVSARRYLADNKYEINNLNGNVSEWIKVDYERDWKKFVRRYHQQLNTKSKGISKGALKMILNTEVYFDSNYNSPKGKMVKGANWYDDRMADDKPEFQDASNAKVFINPDESHSTIGFRFVMRVKLKEESKVLDKIRILGRNLPEMDYSMERKPELKNDKDVVFSDPPGFLFIPMGTFETQGKTTSVQAFYAQENETTNFQWMLFLNDLIDKNRVEDLKECIPNDKDWAYKMTYETDSISIAWKKDFTAEQTILFSKKFKKANNIKDISVTSFALKPVVGISHKAAEIFALWISKIYGPVNNFRLPTESEWEWMAYGNHWKNQAYAWDGPYTRNYKGVFMANFQWGDLYYELDTNKIKDIKGYYRARYANKQNLEHTRVNLSQRSHLPGLTTFVVGHFPPNNFGLYDICGNAAEMVQQSNITKGGSWASPAFYLQINQKEKWSGTPSDCVGFRLVQTYLGSSKK